MSMVKRYSVVWWDYESNNKKYTVFLELPSKCSVTDCIKQTIRPINEQIKLPRLALELDPQLYLIYHAKENGKPILDFPGKNGNEG